MARKGRKPKPTAIKKAAGNLRRDRLNEHEPRHKIVNLPVPAQFLEKRKQPDGSEVMVYEVARAEWLRVAPELARCGVLTKVDEKALIGYCMAWQRWVQAQAKIPDADHYVVLAKSGYAMPNPYLTIADKAMEQMRKFASEFGMTPSSRSGLYASPESPKENPSVFDRLNEETLPVN